MLLNMQEIYLLMYLELNDRVLRKKALKLLQDDFYPHKQIKPTTLKSKLRKSVEKLTQSGCIKITRNIFDLEARSSIYSITEKGIAIAREIQQEGFQVYKL